MDEQLELFGSSEFPEEEKPPAASEPRQLQPAAAPRHHTLAASGLDTGLTEAAQKFALALKLPKLAESVTVIWNPRMRTAAGRAFYQIGKIELNPKLQTLPGELREKEIEGTFLHELAHLVSHARAGKRRIQPHGPEWRQACTDLGIDGEDRCHSLDFSPRRMKRKFAYECPSCKKVIERVRRMKRKVACFPCCREFSEGLFDSRYELVERRIQQPE